MIGQAEPLKMVSESLAALYARMESALGRSNKARAYLTERGLAGLEKVGYNPGAIYKGLRQCVVFGLLRFQLVERYQKQKLEDL